MNRLSKLFVFSALSLFGSTAFGVLNPQASLVQELEARNGKKELEQPDQSTDLVPVGNGSHETDPQEMVIADRVLSDVLPATVKKTSENIDVTITNDKNKGIVIVNFKMSAKRAAEMFAHIPQLLKKKSSDCIEYCEDVLSRKKSSFTDGVKSSLRGLRRGLGRIVGFTAKITIYMVATIAAVYFLGEIFALLAGYNIPLYAVQTLWAGLSEVFVNACTGLNAPQFCVLLGRGIFGTQEFLPVVGQCVTDPGLVSEAFPLCAQVASSVANAAGGFFSLVPSWASVTASLPAMPDIASYLSWGTQQVVPTITTTAEQVMSLGHSASTLQGVSFYHTPLA